MDKAAIKNFAITAREKLISTVKAKAALVGITEEGVAKPLPPSKQDILFFDVGTPSPYKISGTDVGYRRALVDRLSRDQQKSDYKTVYRSLIEETAYTWFNRLIAIRFMEVNGYLPEAVRVVSSDNPQKREPDIVTRPLDSGLRFSAGEEEQIRQWKKENRPDALFRFLFIRECERLGEILPGLFTKTGDEKILLFPLDFTDPLGVVRRLVTEIPEEDFDVNKGGQVEIIGWLYQYYNSQLKDEVFALLAKNVKVTKERLPAATQLFTPDWIVRYMVENSLGRLWQESHKDEELKSQWKYYLEEAPQTEDVRREQEKARRKIASPEDIRFIDPCMGSGHILVYAFDLLMQIYLSAGYSRGDAAQKIIEKNLYGLDIDERAYQLAYFAVIMKGCQYSRRILEKGLSPNLFAVRNSDFLTRDHIKSIAGKNREIADRLTRLKAVFERGDEFGSLINVPDLDFSWLIEHCEQQLDEEETMFRRDEETFIRKEFLPLIRTAETLAKKYDVVVTNPPYMGRGNMNASLSEFVNKRYPDSKGDLSTVFMQKTL
ncbi:MAG: BREX-1 system adenine-specific DNA-methyltransferase PglX, partial [Thermoguttaceae bacterium]|nr:BREX-1 system adenine-specific DNA-methyltransferase PglX [Thermoguttaceae bacterium]